MLNLMNDDTSVTFIRLYFGSQIAHVLECFCVLKVWAQLLSSYECVSYSFAHFFISSHLLPLVHHSNGVM